MANTVDEYINGFPDTVQAVLKKVRAAVHEAVPDAEEKITYGIPTLTLHGKYAVYFSGWKHHISLYPIPSDPSLRKELEPFVAGKGTLQFSLDKPVPYDLVKKVAAALARDNKARTGNY